MGCMLELVSKIITFVPLIHHTKEFTGFNRLIAAATPRAKDPITFNPRYIAATPSLRLSEYS